MIRYVARRLATLVPLLLLASLLIFSMVRLMPGDAAINLLPPDASADQIEALREQLGLNEPFLTQYVTWLSSTVRGDFGESLARGEPIGAQITRAGGVTFQVAVAGLALALAAALPLGFLSGMKPNGAVSRFLDGFTTIAFAVPNFWLGILLILLFAVTLGLLPTSGFTSLTEDPVEGLRQLILPSITLALTQAAVLAAFLRSSVDRVRESEFVTAAVANGLPRRVVRYRHILRNALIPVVTVAALIFGRLLGGAVIVETLFSIPGLGRLLVTAITMRDFPVIQGVLSVVVAGFAMLNLFTDLLYGRLDPRIRLS